RAARVGARVARPVLSKGAFREDHPLFLGVHIGAISPPGMLRRVDRADLVLNLGAMRTDMDLGSRPPQVTRDRTIWAVDGRVHVSFHTYTDVHIRDFVRGLLRTRLRRHRDRLRYHDNLPRQRHAADAPLELT